MKVQGRSTSGAQTTGHGPTDTFGSERQGLEPFIGVPVVDLGVEEETKTGDPERMTTHGAVHKLSYKPYLKGPKDPQKTGVLKV